MSSCGTQSPRAVDLIDGDFGSGLASASLPASAAVASASAVSCVSPGVGVGADDFEAGAAGGAVTECSSGSSLQSRSDGQ